MKGIYIAKVDDEYSLDIGVSKKILGEINAFRNIGNSIDYIRLKNKEIYMNNKKLGTTVTRYFACRDIYKCIKKIKLDYDFAYLRYCRGNYNFLRIIKLLHRNGIKIVVEIPTYPYRSEIDKKSIKGVIDLTLDKIITPLLHKYVFRISVTSDDSDIFSIKTIGINNGIEIDRFPMVNHTNKSFNKINLVGIGNLAKWHGYDRVIEGLNDYYKDNINKCNEEVNFYIIGEGSEKNNLRELTEKYKLNDYVHFLGAKNGEELDHIFDEMDIGVSSLALYRAGGGHDPIKSKEFLARGIPIILGYKDRLINMGLPYIFEIEENDKSVDIKVLLEKYKNTHNISSEEIREYAKENLTWEFQMKKIIVELKQLIWEY
ncbi:glycosyltransferase [Clostridium chromiireducens]|uniref:Glycosyl transferases group 1 n=1 Tax=Clostridium chromiireducens TaxID=225345 RepID=A0A1V4IGW8_9CLOT|nr:glycosyltransferase [Clostridium chromiireducens]OPJ59169.1 glycosyl transferases group 1 [Clostridium chromiireducens]RII33888.1 glycosyltransferase [Clostridium chromiireducens]